VRRVVATRTGLLVAGLRSKRFVPYTSVESVRECLDRRRTIVVSLREPVAGTRRFAFVPSHRPGLGVGDEHPTRADLRRRLAAAR